MIKVRKRVYYKTGLLLGALGHQHAWRDGQTTPGKTTKTLLVCVTQGFCRKCGYNHKA